ncbi:TonB-dependent receptor [Sphingomonas sp. C3-2]|uniref:TonB-dependent receptor family protein n=1 Tax=Sphingomonas sp. C3-2 TaxID=3062169 RepID=UPI00294B4EC8|nr:TonB-dependent receptor [Sphingomonas sp. C3-2]WOK37702.1 TonB-dependent receptor [Sphingomonas sp. C3-2]
MSKIVRALSGASVLALACAASPVLADDDQPIIVTAQSTETAEQEITRTPGGADLVSAAAFENRVAVTLRDALAMSPGVYAQPRYGQEIRLSIRGSGLSRGYHMRGITLLQDGVPINLADNSADFQELDPQIFQHIAVYRGSNALRFGSATLGGGINAVTPTGRTSPGYELRLDGGSFNTLGTKAAAGFADEHADAWLAITADRSDGDRAHSDRSALRFNGNVGLRLGARVESRFYATINHVRQDMPGALTREDAIHHPGMALPNAIAMDQARDVDSLRLQNRTTVALGAGTLEAGLFYNAKQLHHPIFQLIDQKSEDYGAYARLALAGNLAGMDAEAIIGGTARFGHIDARQYLNLAGKRGAQTSDARHEAQTLDGYFEFRLKPAATLSLIAGGAYIHGERNIANFTRPNMGGTASFDRFAPKFGLLYEPAQNIQFYANYSRSVELPGLTELAQTQVGGLTGFVDLAPQRGWTFEFGTRGERGLARWDITAYRSDLEGELLQYNPDPISIPAIPSATFNAGRTRHQGIEAALALQLAPFALLTQSYQFNDFRFRGDSRYGNNRLPVLPQHLYRAELRLCTAELALTPRLEWVPRGAWADYENTTRTRGYALIGLGAEAVVRPGVTLFADARNLTNKRAIGDISAVVTATDASAIYYPVERRALYGGVRMRF